MKRKIAVTLILAISLLSFSVFFPPVYGFSDGVITAPMGTSIADGAIDGIAGAEWADAGDWNTTTMGGDPPTLPHRIRGKHDSTYLYLLLEVADGTDEPYGTVGGHDWVGIEFDLNNDSVIHGTPSNPDDWAFCDYAIAGGDDWWTQGFMGSNRFVDTDVGGSNDVVAAHTWNTTHTIWEFKKELDSGDTAGYDIAMDHTQTGVYGKDRIVFALAYQEGGTGKHYVCSHLTSLLVLTGPLPSYTLTINSSPMGVTFTADGVPHTTPWSDTYTKGTSVTLEMPQTSPGYRWVQWLEDGDPVRIKTVTVTADTTLTGVYEPLPPDPSVGGTATPISISTSIPNLPIPLMVLTTILPLVAAVGLILLVKKRNVK